MFAQFLKVLNKLINQEISTKLKTFSEDKLKIIYSQLNYLQSKSARFLEVNKKTSKKFEKSKQIEKVAAKKVKSFALLKDVIYSLHVSQARDWYEKSCAILITNKAWWNERLAQLPARTSQHQRMIEQLQLTWQQQGDYAVFSTPDLIGVYWRQFQVIGEWITSIQQEFQRKIKQFSTEEAEEYQIQLNHLETAFQAEKFQIRAALLDRLSIGIQRGDLYFDDLVVSTVQQLEQLGAIDSMRLPKGVRRHMAPDILNYIQQIIGIDGSPDEKVHLASLLYAQSTRPISISLRINHLGITFAVPHAVSDVISIKPPFYTKLPKGLQFLFRGEKAIYEFFQHRNCQYLIIAEQHLVNYAIEPGITIETLKDSISWRYVNQLAGLLAKESKRQQTKKAALSTILYSDAHEVLNGYQLTLVTVAQQLFHKQLQVFDALLTHLETQLETRQLTETEIFEIETVKMQLAEFQRTWGASIPKEQKNLLARYLKIEDIAAKPYVSDTVFEQATEVTQKIQTGKEISVPEQMLLVEASNQLSHSNNTSSYSRANFVLNHRISQRNVKKYLKAELEKSALTFTSQELIEHLQAIKKQLEDILLIEPSFNDSADMQTAFYRYFYYLLEAIQNLSNRAAFTRLEGHVLFILKTLLTFPMDDTLRHIVEQLVKSIDSFKRFGWDLFKQIAIVPHLNALSETLQINISVVVSEKNTQKSVRENMEFVASQEAPATQVVTAAVCSF